MATFRDLFRADKILYWLLVFVPLVFAAHFAHASPVWVFALACAAIIPLAGFMGQATEVLADRAGPSLGGLLNATFGNAAELVIAIIALRAGQIDIVQASLTGSIIGNVLFVLGLAILSGGIGREKQTFNRTEAGLGASMLIIATIGLLVPTVLYVELRDRWREKHPAEVRDMARAAAGLDAPAASPPRETADLPPAARAALEEKHALDAWMVKLSLGISAVLIAIYLLKLYFSLFRRKGTKTVAEAEDEEEHGPAWGLPTAIGVLLVATVLIAVVAEWLVHAVEPTIEKFGFTATFVGVIVIAIIGNAAEHSTAVMVARKDKMDLAISISIESSMQIALFVAPVLCFVGLALAPKDPMTLHFTNFEVFAVAVSVGVVHLIALDGESNWMEGVLLLGVYAILATAFYFV